MKVWKATDKQVVKLEEIPPSLPEEETVKIKMRCASLSSVEKAVYNCEKGVVYPRVLGSHGVGMVTETHQSVHSFKRGDRVYVASLVACGQCYYCKSGRKNECTHLKKLGKDIDGVLSDFAFSQTDNIYKIPEKLTDEQAFFVEMVALAINAIKILQIEKGDHFVIVGADIVGIIMAQVALYYQAVPVIVDDREERLAVAMQKDIYYCVNSKSENVVKKIYSITGGKMASHVAYTFCGGMSSKDVLELVSPYGNLGVVYAESDDSDLVIGGHTVLDKSITVSGINHANDYIEAAINLLFSGYIDTADLLQKIPFDSVKDYLDNKSENDKSFGLMVKI